METVFTGAVTVVGDNIDTDQIYPDVFWSSQIPEKLERTVFAELTRRLPPPFPREGSWWPGAILAAAPPESMRRSPF